MKNMNEEQMGFLFSNESKAPVVSCLGKTFVNDLERRKYFSGELKKKLPELREKSGFPLASDEEILKLSDPPYFTLCPNPWINEFLSEWGGQNEDEYNIEPFVADVSEGKNDLIYNAHTYHTKVPPKAILRYLLHYTKPGDVIFDGFSGTGMAGVAASMCNIPEYIRQLGYNVEQNDILDPKGKNKISEVGERKVILGDLAPIATFISKNYNMYLNSEAFREEALSILARVESKLGWMYETKLDNGSIATVNYTVWSDNFACKECATEFVFHEVATNPVDGKVMDEFHCPNCNAKLNKKALDKVWESKLDTVTNEIIQQTKSTPVLICYKEGRNNKFKPLNDFDFKVINRVENYPINNWVPTDRMPEGDEARRNDRTGITHVHHFYSKRNLIILAEIRNEILNSNYKDPLLLWFTSHLINLSKLNRYRPGVSFPYNPLSGTLYIGSQVTESNVFIAYRNKIEKITGAFIAESNNTVISTQSQVNMDIKDNSIDYIFTDPPFGANIMYSELSFLWEAWLGIKTNNMDEAIINKTQNKDLKKYQDLMEESFKQYYRVLKPGRWVTIEFSNSKASVWNALQNALGNAGFTVANVSILDKKLGSFKAVTTTTAVKQDLVITAYKPKTLDNEKIKKAKTVESCWMFTEQHLKHLSIIGNASNGYAVPERTPRILFDRMVAYHVQNGLPVPISSAEYQEVVANLFPMRDGMVFLESQVAEYDKKRITIKDFIQMNLFVSDENSAIEWIRQKLLKKPQSRQDIHPDYIREIQHISKHEQLPELDDLLVQNFLCYEGGEEVPNQIATYLRSNYHDMRGLDNHDPKMHDKAMNRWYVPDPNKQADLEKLREKALLREFEGYVEELASHKKKLKVFRTEAIRAGFKKAWSEKDYAKIVTVGDRLPESVIQEDDKLLMYYDSAQTRLDM